MDANQQLSQLDPKIKEAYDKVMNTTIPSSPPHDPQSAPSQPAPAPSDSHTSQPTPPPSQPAPAEQPSSAPMPSQPAPTIVAGVSPSVTSKREPETVHIGGMPHAAAGKKKSSGVPIVVYILGGIIFLMVYTVFWLKFFNVPVPFLPF